METSEQTEKTSPEEQVLDSIVKATRGGLSDPVEDKHEAPDEANPDENQAAKDGQPESQETVKASEEGSDVTSEQDDDKDKPDDAETESEKPEEGSGEGDKESESNEFDPDAAVAELLGEEVDATKDDPAVLKQKYEESSREAHRLVTERDSMAEALAKANVTLIQTGEDENGKPVFGIAPTEEYAKADVDIDPDEIWNGLDQKTKDLLDTEPKEAFKKIAKKIETELLTKRPPVNAKAEEKVLPQATIDNLWTEFVEAKDKNGKPRYPDADNEEVVTIISKLHQSTAPGMDEFRRLMQQNADFHKLGLSMLYWGASKILLPKKLAQANAEKVAAEKEKQNKKETVIPSGSGSTSVQATATKTPDAESKTLDAIVGALKG